MNVEVVAKDVVINDEVHGRVEQKLEKILDRVNKDTPVRLSVENSRGRFVAQVSMHIFGREIVAQGEQKSMLAAIDEAIDRADRQFKKRHEKLTERRTK
jgi:putative sigma-54 modulation protein